jgi:2-dehydropantoate 2-reductase
LVWVVSSLGMIGRRRYGNPREPLVRLTIIGAGAIGGTIGAHLIRAGHQVLFCDADPGHVDAINRDGLTIEGPVTAFTVPARAVLPADLPDRLDRVAIAVKSHHTAIAAEPLRERLTPDGYLVSFQNGLTADALVSVVGAQRLLVSFVNFGADVAGPGRIMQGNVATLRVGELSGRITTRLTELVAALPYAEATGNILGYLWGKEAYGAMLYAGAVSDLSIADSLEQPRWRPLMLAIAREVLAQAPVRPEAFDGFDPEDLEGSLARLVKFNRASAKSHSGIYRDLMVRRRKTEVDDLLRDLSGPLTTQTGELIRSIERGERTCEVANLELLAAYERTERLGRPLNAVVTLFPAPERVPGGPLHGMQIAVKDMIDIAGWPRGNGNPGSMRDTPAVSDASVIEALRAAGADVFAATSMLEYAAGATHPAVPEAMNPFNPQRTAGGSSGGSAALVGVGACAAALGTDTGGSIRLPAHYCATVGFKPSHGALPLDGVQPLAPTLDHLGLLARDVPTATEVFAALTGAPLAPPVTTPPRVGVISGQFDRAELEPDVAAALRTTVGALRMAGCTVVEVDGSPCTGLEATFTDILLFEAWQVHGARVTEEPGHYGPETLRLLRSGAGVSAAAYQAAIAERARLLPAAVGVHTGVDVLVTPAAPFVAPVSTPPVDTPKGQAEGLFTAVHNLTGAPALVLPCGWSTDGLPIGVQLSAPPGTDMALLATAQYVESVLHPPAT